MGTKNCIYLPIIIQTNFVHSHEPKLQNSQTDQLALNKLIWYTCSMKMFIIYVDMNSLLENTPLIKLLRSYIQ